MSKVAHYKTLETERVQALVNRWISDSDAKLRVLDFGCGKGKYLELFTAGGLDVHGADTNDDYVHELNARGFNVFNAREILKSDEKYDVVFLSHLVEHVGPDNLALLIPKLCNLVCPGGMLVMLTPLLGERFYFDFSHIRPYYPQSIRHAFGQTSAPLSYGSLNCLTLEDIYFFKDPYRTRKLRSFYVGTGPWRGVINAVNRLSDILWRITGGQFGVVASWLGVYRVSTDIEDV